MERQVGTVRCSARMVCVSLNLLLAVALVFGAYLAANPERAWAGSGIVAGWPSQSWTASSGSALNVSIALLSTTASGGPTGPFYTSTGAPPGESNVFISDGWANGSGTKCWKVHFVSTGFQTLTISSQQMSTSLGFVDWDGPRDFKLQYSLDNSIWTDVSGGALTLGSSWIASGRLTNLSLPAALDNQPNVYLRWIMTSNASVGTYPIGAPAQSMIGGIYINGAEIPAAPTDILLSNDTLASADPPGTVVGNLSVVDANKYDTWTYSLVSGTGETDNSSFTIDGNQLKTSTSLAPGTYSIRVNVNDGTYDFAKVFSIIVSAYPAITGGDTEYGDYMTNVAFAGIDHNSGDDNGYADYTALAASVNAGSTYPLACIINVGDGIYPAVVVAWIDWNQNYSFDDAGEKYVIGTNLNLTGPNTASADIAVPADALGGSTRMRIVMNALDGTTEPPNAGSDMFWGDAEDYTVNIGPTAVELAWFTATVRDGAIALVWETASEIDLLGFHVYRQAAEGELVRLNAALLPGQAPGSPVGGSYEFVDEAVAPGVTYWYWLADVDVHGAATLHGPVSASLDPLRRLLPVRPRLAPGPDSLHSR